MVETRYTQGMLAACEIPWTERYALDEVRFRRHIGSMLELGYTNIYVMGTAGEGYAVTDDQFRQVVDVFVEETDRPGLKPQVGVISLSMGQIVERLTYAHDKGVRMFQVSLPSWGALTDSEMMTFFETVCGTFPDSSFLHYNLPRAKRLLTGQDYRRVIDAVPNLVATKNSNSDMGFLKDLMANSPELQHFLVEQGFPYGCLYGECSLLCSFQGVFPNLTKQLYEAGSSGDLDTAFAIQRRMLEMLDGFFGHITTMYMDGAWDKFFSSLVDPEFPRRLLPPYETLPDEDAARGKEYYDTHCQDIS